MYDSAVVPVRLSWPDSPVTHEKTLKFHLVISYYIYINMVQACNPPLPPRDGDGS